MANDEDMFVVIVGDEDSEFTTSELDGNIKIKDERTDNSEYVDFKSLDMIDIKVECLDDEIDQNSLDFYETFSVDYLESEEEYCSDKDSTSKIESIPKRKKKKKGRAAKIIKSSTSTIKKLRAKYSKTESNELIVNELVMLMKKEKPSPPPLNFLRNNDSTLFACSFCRKESVTRPQAVRHYQEKHGPRYLSCYVCGCDFRSKTNLYKHEKNYCSGKDRKLMLKARAIHIGEKAKNRPFLQFAKKKTLKSYYKPKSDIPRYFCPMCPSTFNFKPGLDAHILIHNGERPFQCHECPCAYVSRNALVRHMKKHSSSCFTCDYCGASFGGKHNLVAHMETHLRLRKFWCNLCSLRFATKYSLKLHEDRAHKRLKPPLDCLVCHKSFWRTHPLKTHMEKHHGLSIMTSKMFYKRLPKMSDEELRRQGTLITDGEQSLVIDSKFYENFHASKEKKNTKPTKKRKVTKIGKSNVEVEKMVEESLEVEERLMTDDVSLSAKELNSDDLESGTVLSILVGGSMVQFQVSKIGDKVNLNPYCDSLFDETNKLNAVLCDF